MGTASSHARPACCCWPDACSCQPNLAAPAVCTFAVKLPLFATVMTMRLALRESMPVTCSWEYRVASRAFELLLNRAVLWAPSQSKLMHASVCHQTTQLYNINSPPCAQVARPVCRLTPAPATPQASGSLGAGVGGRPEACGPMLVRHAWEGQRVAGTAGCSGCNNTGHQSECGHPPPPPLHNIAPSIECSPPVTNLSPPSSSSSSPSNHADSRPSSPAYSCSMFMFISALQGGVGRRGVDGAACYQWVLSAPLVGMAAAARRGAASRPQPPHWAVQSTVQHCCSQPFSKAQAARASESPATQPPTHTHLSPSRSVPCSLPSSRLTSAPMPGSVVPPSSRFCCCRSAETNASYLRSKLWLAGVRRSGQGC